MKKLILFLLLSIKFPLLYSQTPQYPRDSTYRFLFFEGPILDTGQLELKVKLNNYEKENILIHKNLIEDMEYGPVGNFYLEIEKFKNGKYEKFVDKVVDYFLLDLQQETRLEYNELKPGDSAVLSFSLISRIGAVYKGKYRIRVNLLKVPNSPVTNGMEYETSRWFSFEVTKDLDYHVIY